MAVGKAAFRVLLKKAEAAGEAAAAKVKLVDYVVGSPRNLMASMAGGSGGGFDLNKPVYVMSGSCGFAWVNVSPGGSKFANWLKKMAGFKADGYYGGVSRSVSKYGQCFEQKEAYAQAMAAVLREGGFKAYAMSRLD